VARVSTHGSMAGSLVVPATGHDEIKIVWTHAPTPVFTGGFDVANDIAMHNLVFTCT
jgi:hypothetical protein